MKERVHVDNTVGGGGIREQQGNKGGTGQEGLRGPGGLVRSYSRGGHTLLLLIE